MTFKELQTELAWTPVVEGTLSAPMPRILVGGMGGSALPADALRFLDPSVCISVHRDYDLPEHLESDTLYVAISYSGNTAETLSFAHAVFKRGLPLVVITTGGELAQFARENHVPLIVVPEGLQPRNALFYLLRALLVCTGHENIGASLPSITVEVPQVEQEGKTFTGSIADSFPLFYASRKNEFLARVSKIILNETAKMPAGSNVFPELNHNEMESFDTSFPSPASALIRFVILRDDGDDPRIIRRMDIFTELMREHGHEVISIPLTGLTRTEKLVRAWYFMHVVSTDLAHARGVDPDAIPLVEDFKRRLSGDAT